MNANIQVVRQQDSYTIKDENRIYIRVKRVLDIIGALIGCIVLIPLTVIVWATNIIFINNGNVFYTHERIGKNGKKFKMYKFRTMCNNAQEMVKDEKTMRKYFTPKQIAQWKKDCKMENDPRITKVGAFLRKTSLDEVPQVINILKGDMSIIGPRPIVEKELEKYGKNKEKFLSVTPGLTGYWAANGRNDTSYKKRMKMELYYIDNLNLILDIKIFFKTIVSVLKKEGAR